MMICAPHQAVPNADRSQRWRPPPGLVIRSAPAVARVGTAALDGGVAAAPGEPGTVHIDVSEPKAHVRADESFHHCEISGVPELPPVKRFISSETSATVVMLPPSR